MEFAKIAYRILCSFLGIFKPAQKKLTTPKQKLSSQKSPSIESCISFEEQWNTGPLLCDGKKCNPSNPCNEAERWLCRDIVSPVVPAGHFRGQFWLNLPSKARRLDFAIETPEGKRIAVEFDGRKTHATDVDAAAFADHLLKQNELVAAGWTILRFSFKQLREQPGLCRELLQNVMDSTEAKWFNKNPVLNGKCPIHDCAGEAIRLKSHKNQSFFWKCTKCNQTFNADRISPKVFPSYNDPTN